MLPFRLAGIRMADEASDTIGGGTKNFLGAVAFTMVLVGGEELGRKILTGSSTSPWWLSLGLMLAAYPVFVSPAIWKWVRKSKIKMLAQLQYLSHEDEELGAAIRMMVLVSAWGKWFTAQSLKNSPRGTRESREDQTMLVARHLVGTALVDGTLQARGRTPGHMDFETIPATHWRDTRPHMVRDSISQWKMVLFPVGGVEFKRDGTIVRASDGAAMERTNKLTAYDSIIVSARQFESLWPHKDKATDKARNILLKKAKKAGANQDDIKVLSGDTSTVGYVPVALLLLMLAVFGYAIWLHYQRPAPSVSRRPRQQAGQPAASSTPAAHVVDNDRQPPAIAKQAVTPSKVTTTSTVTTNAYDIPKKLEIIDQMLRFLREDFTDEIAQGHLLENNWDDYLRSGKRHEYVEALKAFADKCLENRAKSRSWREQNPQYADIDGLMDQSAQDRFVPALNKFRDTIDALPDGQNVDYRRLADTDWGNFRDGVGALQKWKDAEYANALNLRKKLAP
jgi:hypothetical protein